MNPNSKKPGHLFFTPRTPWGTRAGQQSFRQHQRASEDKKPDPNSKEMQGLGGQMAPNQLTGAGGQGAQAGTGGGDVWKVPHFTPSPQTAPQPGNAAPTPSTASGMNGSYHSVPPEAAKPGGHFFMGGEGTKARGEKLDAGIWAGYNTNKSQRVAPFDPKEANDDFIRRSWGQKPFEED